MDAYKPTARTTVRRLPKRAVYDVAAVHAILDEALVCHVSFAHEGGPVTLPMAYGRKGGTLYLHGSAGSRMLGALRGGAPACVAVTLLDGLVLARSAFHHSMNYRSVVLFGRARELRDAAEKTAALCALTEHLTPGRWHDVRRPSKSELARTTVLAFPIEECSAKVRVGPPMDEEEDYARPTWAGVVPLRLETGPPLDDPRLLPGVALPGYLDASRRPETRVIPRRIDTPRLVLRPCAAEDALPFFALVDSNRRELAESLPKTVKALRSAELAGPYVADALRRWSRGEAFAYGAFLRDSAQPAGQVQVKSVDWEVRSAELGYFLDARRQGAGLGREMVEAVVRALDEAGFRRQFVRVLPHNAASLGLARALGFSEEGRHRAEFLTGDGSLADVVYLSRGGPR